MTIWGYSSSPPSCSFDNRIQFWNHILSLYFNFLQCFPLTSKVLCLWILWFHLWFSFVIFWLTLIHSWSKVRMVTLFVFFMETLVGHIRPYESSGQSKIPLVARTFPGIHHCWDAIHDSEMHTALLCYCIHHYMLLTEMYSNTLLQSAI